MSRPIVRSVALAAIGQAALLLSTVYITRALPTQALDQYGTLFQLFTIGIILGTLRLDQGLAYAHSKTGMASLTIASISIAAPVSGLLGIGAYLYLLNTAIPRDFVFCLSFALVVAVMGASFARTLVQFSAANHSYGVVAASGLIRPVTLGSMQVLAVATLSSQIALPYALASAQFIYAAILALVLVAELKALFPLSSVKSIRVAIWNNRKFAFYSLPQNLAYVLGESIVPLALPLKFPEAGAVAIYWLAARVVFAPATVFAESIRPIIYRNIFNRRQDLYKHVIRISGLFFVLFSVPAALLHIFGDVVFRTVFGPQMAPASDVAFILSLLVAFNMASLPIIGSLPVLDLQRAHMFFEIVALVLRVFMMILISWSSVYSLVFATVLAYIGLMACFYGYATVRARRYQWHAIESVS